MNGRRGRPNGVGSGRGDGWNHGTRGLRQTQRPDTPRPGSQKRNFILWPGQLQTQRLVLPDGQKVFAGSSRPLRWRHSEVTAFVARVRIRRFGRYRMATDDKSWNSPLPPSDIRAYKRVGLSHICSNHRLSAIRIVRFFICGGYTSRIQYKKLDRKFTAEKYAAMLIVTAPEQWIDTPTRPQPEVRIV